LSREKQPDFGGFSFPPSSSASLRLQRGTLKSRDLYLTGIDEGLAIPLASFFMIPVFSSNINRHLLPGKDRGELHFFAGVPLFSHMVIR
jgi:hypothetical protein